MFCSAVCSKPLVCADFRLHPYAHHTHSPSVRCTHPHGHPHIFFQKKNQNFFFQNIFFNLKIEKNMLKKEKMDMRPQLENDTRTHPHTHFWKFYHTIWPKIDAPACVRVRTHARTLKVWCAQKEVICVYSIAKTQVSTTTKQTRSSLAKKKWLRS